MAYRSRRPFMFPAERQLHLPRRNALGLAQGGRGNSERICAEISTKYAQAYPRARADEFLPPAPHSIVHRSKKIAEQTNN